jgi:hypothetical protein
MITGREELDQNRIKEEKKMKTKSPGQRKAYLKDEFGEDWDYKIAFARETEENKAIWPALVEKAYAKIHGD